MDTEPHESINETKRLRRLFDRYNRVYWRGKLSGCDVIAVTLENPLGEYDHRKRIIRIDPAKHGSPTQVRSTLLQWLMQLPINTAAMGTM